MKYLMLPHVLLSCELAVTEVTLELLFIVSLVSAAHLVRQVKFQLMDEACDKATLAITREQALGGVVVVLAQFVRSFESFPTTSARISHHRTSLLGFDHLLLSVVLRLRVSFQVRSLRKCHRTLVAHMAPHISVDGLVMSAQAG